MSKRVGPRCAQVGPKLEPTGPSSAQFRPKFGSKSARFTNAARCSSFPSFMFHSAPASLQFPATSPRGSMRPQISCLSNSLGGGTRREATRIRIENGTSMSIIHQSRPAKPRTSETMSRGRSDMSLERLTSQHVTTLRRKAKCQLETVETCVHPKDCQPVRTEHGHK